MKLPFLSLFQSKAPSEYFLALLFRDEQIHAVVFEQLNGRIQVVGEGKEKLTVSLDHATDEMLLDASDKAISVAESSLPNGIQTHKTVFGVKETWVEDAHITKTYLDKLKKISDQLDLKPIGFLVFPEAIAHLLQKEEGAPVSAIFVEPGEKQIAATLIRAGRIIGTKEVALEESITASVETALKQFENVEIFPSRIIVFDGQQEHIEKKFLTHQWSKSLPFLHVPQITTLPDDFDTRAILFGTATQMGLDAIDVIKKPLKTNQASFFPEDEPKKEHVEEVAKEPEEEKEEGEEKHEEMREEEKPKDLEEVTGADTSEYFGFVKGADVAKTATDIHRTPLPDEAIESVTNEIPEEEKERETPKETAYGFSVSGPIFLEGAKKIVSRLKGFFPKSTSPDKINDVTNHVSQVFSGGAKLFLLIPVVVIVLLGGIFWYIFGIHATVRLFLTPKVISKDQSVTFVSGSTDVSKNIIATQQISVTEEGKVSGDATGAKDVGTPAKGTVTIFNSDNSQSHTVTKGTTVTSSSGPTFTLNNDVTVASASGDIFSGTQPGTADVAVTATAIGTDSNLPSNTKFTIAGTSILAAKNANAFSGGTKKSIVVVSQKDLDGLTTQLINNLKDKAKSDLQSKVSSDSVVLPDFTNTSASQQSFDKKVGDETQNINLDAVITYTTIAYKKSDLQDFTKQVLSSQFPSGLTLSPDGVTYAVKDMNTAKDGTIKATLTAKASLIPTVDTTSLRGQIAGKSFTQAKDILSGIQQFSDSTFTLSPNLFFLPKSLPKLSQNITITVSTND